MKRGTDWYRQRPVNPPNPLAGLEVAADGLAQRREESFLAKTREEPESLQLVLDGALQQDTP
jgi:hypothetical protein